MNIRQTVVENDLRILDVASYVASKGSVMDTKSLAADPDKLQAYQDKVMSLFDEYKQRIRKKCFTLAELEEREYTKWGITEEVPTKAGMKLEDILSGKVPLPEQQEAKDKDDSNPIGFKGQ